MKRQNKTIYLDYAATTPVDPAVVKAMQPYWSAEYGNPASLYKSGKTAQAAIIEARKTIAQFLNCSAKEIIFTGGGTESVNLAIQGIAKEFITKHKKPGHIITTPIEHHAVLHTVEALQNYGWKIDYVPVDKEGFVKLEALKKLVRPDTALISVMYANNEIGTVEPIEEIGFWLAGLNKTRKNKIYFHTDACQASGVLGLDVNKLRVDLMSLNASKIYGPKGIGLLYIRSGVKLQPIIYGGGQEQNLRSGTENVPAIVGFAKALELAQKNKNSENKRLAGLRDYFITELSKLEKFTINGPKLDGKSKQPHRLPNNINLTFPGIEGETLMLYLDAKGIAISTGSACATTSTDPSHVLVAIGTKPKQAFNAVRLTLGKQTTKAQISKAVEAIKQSLKLIRKTI